MPRLNDADEALKIKSDEIGRAVSIQSYAFNSLCEVLLASNRDKVKYTQEQRKHLNVLFVRAIVG